jgi:hypothetical protein
MNLHAKINITVKNIAVIRRNTTTDFKFNNEKIEIYTSL